MMVCDAPFLYVLDGRDIEGFIMPTDVNKQAGRTYFYLRLAEFEVFLADLLRHLVESTDLEQRLGEERLNKLVPAIERDKGRDVATDLVSYMNFADLLRVAGRTPEILGRFGCASKTVWDKETGALDGLRNKVMHPAKPLLKEGRAIGPLLKLDQRLQDLLQRAYES